MSVRTLVIPFYYGSGPGSGTVINYGSGSDFLARYGSSSGSGSGSTTLPGRSPPPLVAGRTLPATGSTAPKNRKTDK